MKSTALVTTVEDNFTHLAELLSGGKLLEGVSRVALGAGEQRGRRLRSRDRRHRRGRHADLDLGSYDLGSQIL